MNITEIQNDQEDVKKKIVEGKEEVIKRGEKEEKEKIKFCNECNKYI